MIINKFISSFNKNIMQKYKWEDQKLSDILNIFVQLLFIKSNINFICLLRLFIKIFLNIITIYKVKVFFLIGESYQAD